MPGQADHEDFVGLSRQEYESRAHARRNVERWVENIVNASIDIAKILAASSGKRIPPTYRSAVGVGGTPASFARAGTLGAPLMVAVIGGETRRFAPLVDL